ncbi:hypothetical protein DIPPA_26064 [Diplonema papillatum]|nr:hypothetical protein DIPPA_26064 [Diplonema papillatum]
MPAPSHEATTASLRRRRPVPLQGDVISMEIISGDPATSPLLLNGRENTAREVALIVSSLSSSTTRGTRTSPAWPSTRSRSRKELQKTTEEVHIVTKLPWDHRLAFPNPQRLPGPV